VKKLHPTLDLRSGCSVEEIRDEEDLCQRAAPAIVEGVVLGWFQRCMSGARAHSAIARSRAIRGAAT
jgi:hypothetical protein